jgi:hypothetical protein
MDEQKYTLVDFTPEEAENVSEDIAKVLKKYEAEFYINRIIDNKGTFQASLSILKRVLVEPVPSPFTPNNGESIKENPNTSSEEGSTGGREEPSK